MVRVRVLRLRGTATHTPTASPSPPTPPSHPVHGNKPEPTHCSTFSRVYIGPTLPTNSVSGVSNSHSNRTIALTPRVPTSQQPSPSVENTRPENHPNNTLSGCASLLCWYMCSLCIRPTTRLAITMAGRIHTRSTYAPISCEFKNSRKLAINQKGLQHKLCACVGVGCVRVFCLLAGNLSVMGCCCFYRPGLAAGTMGQRTPVAESGSRQGRPTSHPT